MSQVLNLELSTVEIGLFKLISLGECDEKCAGQIFICVTWGLYWHVPRVTSTYEVCLNDVLGRRQAVKFQTAKVSGSKIYIELLYKR